MLSGIAAPALVLLLANKATAATTPSRNTSPYTNLKAFLMMIQYAEGTYGPNAYRMLFGGRLFSGYEKHPDIAVTIGDLTSTAAGAYQILYRTWQAVHAALQLPDFSPQSQDRAAIELIRRRGALEDVLAGRFSDAIYKCRKEWASLPGAGYGQRERDLQLLAQVYYSAGGQIA